MTTTTCETNATLRCFGCLGSTFTEGECDHCGKPVPVMWRLRAKVQG